MNRRELFKGLTAALAAASIPVPLRFVEEVYGISPAMSVLPMLEWLERQKLELINKMIYPPAMLVNNRPIPMPTTHIEVALREVEKAIKELST